MAQISPSRALALLLLLAALSACHVTASSLHPTPKRDEQDDLAFHPSIVELVNSQPSAGWVAGYNPRVHGLTRRQLKALMGTFRHPPKGALPVKQILKHQQKNRGSPSSPRESDEARRLAELSLPSSFDAREKWAHCPTIGHIRDQGHCGSCWAFGAVEALSDRFCIHLNESVDLSTEDLLSCCGVLCGDGCEGGWPYKAWQYFKRSGVVTESCQPYFDQKGCTHPGCSPVAPTPACHRTCAAGMPFGKSKHFAADAYTLEPYSADIMLELYENGPVEVDFEVYEDFTYYKSGVYRHVAGDLVGGHAVKLVGWGATPDGTPFWRIANSWNSSWGEEGYFRILRGSNECGIEEDVVGGLPSSRHAAGEPWEEAATATV